MFTKLNQIRILHEEMSKSNIDNNDQMDEKTSPFAVSTTVNEGYHNDFDVLFLLF